MRACADHETQSRARNDDARVGCHLALLDQVIDQRRRQNSEVERLPRFDLLFKPGGQTILHKNFVPRGALELGSEIFHHCFESVGAEDPDLGGLRNTGLTQDEQECDSKTFDFHARDLTTC